MRSRGADLQPRRRSVRSAAARCWAAGSRRFPRSSGCRAATSACLVPSRFSAKRIEVGQVGNRIDQPAAAVTAPAEDARDNEQHEQARSDVERRSSWLRERLDRRAGRRGRDEQKPICCSAACASATSAAATSAKHEQPGTSRDRRAVPVFSVSAPIFGRRRHPSCRSRGRNIGRRELGRRCRSTTSLPRELLGIELCRSRTSPAGYEGIDCGIDRIVDREGRRRPYDRPARQRTTESIPP